MSPDSTDSRFRRPPFQEELPSPVFFRAESMPAHGEYPVMCHGWGEFVYSFSGTTEVKAGRAHYIVPPHFGMWIPEGTVHTAFNQQAAVHGSLYISRGLCRRMPGALCGVVVSPLVRAILDHLRELPPGKREHASTERLLEVLVDQLSDCSTALTHIPHTDEPQLEAVLQALRDNPADNRPLSELAAAFHLSERTLIRRARSELGMSLTEWRQRLRLLNALPMLQLGRSVESVALDLGYSTSSAFIAMFRRYVGVSPGRYIGEVLPPSGSVEATSAMISRERRRLPKS